MEYEEARGRGRGRGGCRQRARRPGGRAAGAGRERAAVRLLPAPAPGHRRRRAALRAERGLPSAVGGREGLEARSRRAAQPGASRQRPTASVRVPQPRAATCTCASPLHLPRCSSRWPRSSTRASRPRAAMSSTPTRPPPSRTRRGSRVLKAPSWRCHSSRRRLGGAATAHRLAPRLLGLGLPWPWVAPGAPEGWPRRPASDGRPGHARCTGTSTRSPSHAKGVEPCGVVHPGGRVSSGAAQSTSARRRRRRVCCGRPSRSRSPMCASAPR